MLLVGNWKMSPDTLEEALMLAKETGVIAKKNKNTIVVCPPYIYLGEIGKKTKVLFGAQAVSPHLEMPHTGEVSAKMLQKLGASYTIVGHSERRSAGFETNDIVAQNTLRLIEKKIRPIICVGEKSRDTKGAYLLFVKEQIVSAIALVPKTKIKELVFAYEPVWAIGSHATRPATVEECREMIIFIRKTLADAVGEKVANIIPVLYGGSVDEQNAKNFLSEGGAHGLLVGRVSTDIKKFTSLIQSIS
ncbi:MAG: triose-phosphate isomerase [bacterium]